MARIGGSVAIVLALVVGCSKADKSSPKYWEKLLSNPRKAQDALSRIGDEVTEPAHKEWAAKLVVKFYDQAPEAAAKALGKLGHADAAAVAKLLEGLRSQVPGLMANAAEALGKLGAKAAVPQLIEILERWVPKHPRFLTEVRKQAVKALGALGAREAIPSLMKMARETGHGRVVNYLAVRALAKMADPRSIPALIEALYLPYPEDKLSATARLALNRIGKAAIPALLRVVRRKDPAVEKMAREKKMAEGQVTAVPFLVLGDIGDSQTAQEIAEEFLPQEDSLTKVNALVAIGHTASSDMVGKLVSAYRKGALEVRLNILHALHRIGSRRALPFLVGVLRKPEDPNLLWTAGLAVSYLGGEEELDDVEAVLKKAKRDLPSMKGEDAQITNQTIKLFTDFAARLRAAKGCTDAACWAQRLKSPDKQARIKAARMLAFVRDKRTAEQALLGAAGDPDGEVREEIAFALSRVGTRKAAEVLVQRAREDREKSGMRVPNLQYRLVAARLARRDA